MLKKITIIIWLVTALILAVLVINYYSNRQFIKNYDSGVYQENELGFLGFTQPYIGHFNKGNLYFRLRNHTKAKQQYQAALNLKPDDPYDCKIRVNYALAYVEPINVKKITKDNYQDTIKICETAKSILAENKCATEDNKGHYYAAQKLYNEINAFIEELRNQFENPTPTPTPAPTPTAVLPASGGSGTGSASSGSGSSMLGSGAVMPTSGQSSSGNADASSTPYTSLTGSSGSGITNTSANQGRSYTGAYILAAAAAAVIIGAIAVMALYMRGKISLGKFEQILGGEQSSDNNGDGDEFYNPDDFKDT